ncbi:hypothetical protein [Streptomyces chartreusis]
MPWPWPCHVPDPAEAPAGRIVTRCRGPLSHLAKTVTALAFHKKGW